MRVNKSTLFKDLEVNETKSMTFKGSIVVTDLLAFYASKMDVWNELNKSLIYKTDPSDEEVDLPIFAGQIVDKKVKILFVSLVDSFVKKKQKYYELLNIKGELNKDSFPKVDIESGLVAISSKDDFYKFHGLKKDALLDPAIITIIDNVDGELTIDETNNLVGIFELLNE